MHQQNQHYVPKFYLNNFAINNHENDKKIFQYNIDNPSTSGKKLTKEVCSEYMLYGMPNSNDKLQLEKYFSKIENDTAPIFKKIISNKSINDLKLKEWDLFFKFLWLLQSRNPTMKNSIEPALNFIKGCNIKNFTCLSTQEAFTEIQFMDIPIQVFKIRDYQIIQGDNFFTSDDPICYAWSDTMTLEYRLEYGYDKNKNCISENKGQHKPHLGISNTMLIFPLSPKLCLIGYEKNTKLKFLDNPEIDAEKEVNAIIETYANKYVFLNNNKDIKVADRDLCINQFSNELRGHIDDMKRKFNQAK